ASSSLNHIISPPSYPFLHCKPFPVKKVAVVTDKAPATLGSHSQVINANNFLFVSSVLGFYSKPEVHLDQIEDQTEQVLKNMGEILKAGVANYSAVVKTTIMPDIRQMPMPFPFTAYHFPSPAPARSTCRVAALPLDAKVEFECIAALKA
ncbi:hypothetical protein V6Z11_A01G084900, partial [Gossypium hirsutum]